ncbi:hypothetical protein H4R99_004587 [Coemansia sp. RSA 1722]|nr:hypothetical protein LPJ57_004169 [Coemansia sp. RSA 486]KAJ2232831.1 hypothetical protein IWW45_004670 [Coemansia sp. RSA 485]KAJ2594414.1 hypothetical protein GGF39_004210 [Coemansia sp. RSA 1721]KAJ2597239.1 hypothetical protein H4R99_004587 [Coemansia sp. RSA 1722]
MDVSTLAPRIREILQLSDLSTVSAKKVRRQLEHEMNINLDAYKTDIDEIIKNQFQQIHNETQQRQQAQQQYASQYAAQQGGHMGMYGLSPSVQGLQMPPGGFHSTPMHHAQIPGGSMAPGMIHGSGTAATATAPEDQTPRKRGRPRKPENLKKQQRKKREVDPSKPKRQTGLSKPMKLSDDLRAFLEQKYCARLDVVKKLWEYIKKEDLQDPADKRYILCDDQMKKLFDCDRLFMYTMNKLLNDHLTKPTPEENAEAIALLGLPPSHPANADSAGLGKPTGTVSSGSGTANSGAPESPAPSDGGTEAHSEVQQSGDNSAEEDDDDDGASQPVSPGSQQPISPSLALPSQSANSNATN